MMQITFEFTPEHYHAFNNHFVHTCPHTQRRLQRSRVGLAVFLVAILLGLPLMRARDWQTYGMCLIVESWLFLMPLAFYFYIPWAFYRRCRKFADAFIQDAARNGQFGEDTVTLSNSGVSSKSHVRTNSVQWSAVPKIERTADFGFIYMTSQSAFVIPMTAFESPDEFHAFMDAAEQFRRHAERVS